jgi:hypothetical protein
LRYDLYRLYFPLLALSRFSEAIAALEKPEDPEQFVAQVPPGERILLLPHCLRRSAVCAAKPSEQGLQCASCTPECPINQLQRKALELGYREVCVASGGHMALKHVAESKPSAVVAVACAKELAEGIEGVKALMSGDSPPPPIAIIPLTKDGCVDTEVDIEQALRVVALGCEPERSVPEQAASAPVKVCGAAWPVPQADPLAKGSPKCPIRSSSGFGEYGVLRVPRGHRPPSLAGQEKGA